MTFKSISQYLLWICGFLGVSFMIGQTTQAGMPWYDTLTKSPYNPPKIIFPIVWTKLYIMLSMVGCYLWRKREVHGKVVFSIFAVYMFVNWAWSYIFFFAHYIEMGFYWIILSNLILGVLMLVLYKNNLKKTALALVPTFVWGCYAAYLNGYIVMFN